MKSEKDCDKYEHYMAKQNIRVMEVNKGYNCGETSKTAVPNPTPPLLLSPVFFFVRNKCSKYKRRKKTGRM
jgi:hypothetical protein